MKKMFSGRLLWVKITESALLILLGILVAVLGGIYYEYMPHALTICISVFLGIDGLITLMEFWLEPKKNFTFSTILGALFIATCSVLCIYAANGSELGVQLVQFIAILLTTFGGIFLIKGIIQVTYKGPIGWSIIHFLIATACLALGITCICFAKEEVLQIVLVVLGIAISVLGVLDLVWSIVNYRQQLKEKEKKAEEKAAKEKEEKENPEQVKIDAEIDETGTVRKKGKKKKISKKDKVKEIPLETPAIETAEQPSEEKTDDSTETKSSEETPVEPEVIDPIK